LILLRIRYSNVGPERNAIQARERTLAARSSHTPRAVSAPRWRIYRCVPTAARKPTSV